MSGVLVGGGLPAPDPIQPVGLDGNPLLPLADPGYQDVDPEAIALIPKASELFAVASAVAVSPASPDLLNSVLKEIDSMSKKGGRSVAMAMDRASATSLCDGFNAVRGWTASTTVDYSHGAFSATSVLNVAF